MVISLERKLFLFTVVFIVLSLFGVRSGICAYKIELTAKEKAFLTKHPQIRIGIMSNWPPMNFVDAAGRPKGIGVDYVEALNKRLGNVLVIEPAPFAENYEKVKNKELDALMDITPKKERDPFFEFTQPYLVIPHVIVGREGGAYFSTEKELNGRAVALEKGYYNITHFRENYPEVMIREYGSTSDALDAVARGEADAYAGNRAVVLHIIERELISNLQLQGKLRIPESKLTIGVRKDWPILVSILNKAFRAIPPGEKDAIYTRWIRVRFEPWYLKKEFWLVLLASTGIVVLIGMLALIWNRSLMWLVARRTEELRREITERKRAEEKLKRSESQLKEAERIAQIGSWELDLRKNVLNWSDEIYRIFEIDPKKFGASYEAFLNAIHPEDREIVNKAYTDSVKNKTFYNIVHRLLMSDGRIKFVREHCETFYDKQGNPVSSLGTVQDITTLRLAEMEKEKLLHDLGERIKELKCIAEISRLAEQPGISVEGFVERTSGLLPSAFQHPQDACARITMNGTTFKTPNFKETDWSQSAAIKVDGLNIGKVTICYLKEKPLADGGPFLKEEKELINVVADFLGHIIQHKRTEKQIKESEIKYRSLVDNAPVGVYRTSVDGWFIFMNASALRIFEYSSLEELRSIKVASFYEYPEDRQILIDELKENGRVDSFEALMHTKTGKKINVLLSATLVDDELTGMIMDVTQRKREEEERNKRLEELEIFHKATVGRELKMVELEKEINSLLKELGREPKYRTE